LILALFFTARAEARVYIQIDQPGDKKFPIAIDNPVPVNRGESKDWSRKMTEIIKSDLTMTGLFDIIPQEQYPKEGNVRAPIPSAMQFPAWSVIGAQALVNGNYSNVANGMQQLEMHLYDPGMGQLLVAKTYTAKDKDYISIAHQFADEIVLELTGERGVFSTQIAYVQASKKRKEIGVMDMDGENAHNITKQKGILFSPAWSPDGGTIAFSYFTKAGDVEIATVPSAGGPVKAVTTNGTINISPTYSPSGELTIASGMNGDTELYIVDMAGQALRKLTDNYGIDVNPGWSPDGSWFVFSSERAGRLNIFKSSADGGTIQRLTFVGTQNDNPVWSPNGQKIAFQSLAGGWDIYVMNADGSMLQRLTSNGASESPSWSPNGRFIAYSSNRQVTIMREDGSNPTTVGPEESLQPTWGPWVK
jgi:TolB protein